MFRIVLRNTAANYLLRAANVALNLFAIPVFIQVLGEAGFGLIVLAGVVVGYFYLMDLGLTTSITKYVSEYQATDNREKTNELIASSVVLFALLGVVLCIGILIAIRLDAVSLLRIDADREDDAIILFRMAAVLSLFAWPKMAYEGALRGLQLHHQLNIIQGITRALSVGAAIVLTLQGASLGIIFLAFNLDKVLGLFLLHSLTSASLCTSLWKWSHVSLGAFSGIISFSLWLALGKLAAFLEYQLDQVILSLYLSVSTIAVYTIIVYPFRVIQEISGLFSSALLPYFSQIHARDKYGARQIMVRTLRYHNAILASISVVGIYFSVPLVRLWVGDQYAQYDTLIIATCAFQLIWQSNGMLGEAANGFGIAKRPGLVALGTGIANLVLSLLLVPTYGVTGVILGTLLAGTGGVVAFIYFIYPILGDHHTMLLGSILRGQQGPLLVAAALMPAFSTIQKINHPAILLGALLGVSITLASAAFFFGFDEEERHYIILRLRSIARSF